jgi:hypothetical protein
MYTRLTREHSCQVYLQILRRLCTYVLCVNSGHTRLLLAEVVGHGGLGVEARQKSLRPRFKIFDYLGPEVFAYTHIIV